MKENRKVTLEQGDKRIILEQGIEDHISETPQWDALIHNTKEGTAKYATIFGKALIHSLIPAFFLITGFLILSYFICGGM